MTTGMERLTAAINGGACDRVPVFSIMLDQGAKELGMSLEEYYSRGEAVAEGQLRLRAKYGYDNLWCLFYVGKEAELLGCRKVLFASDGPPNVGELVIKKREDIHNLEIPRDMADHPAFAEPLKCMRILRAESGGRYPICVYLTASITLPAILMGMDRWMDLLLNGPAELRDELLIKSSEFFRAQLEVYRKAGAHIFVYSNPYGSTDILPKKLLENVSIPWMKRDLAGQSMDGFVYYCGGARLNRVIDLVARELGFNAFYLSPWDDIAEGKRLVAGRGLVGAAINDTRLIDWSEKEIRAEVKRMMEAGLPGGRFLFGTLLMPYRIPEANLRVLFESAYEFGAI